MIRKIILKNFLPTNSFFDIGYAASKVTNTEITVNAIEYKKEGQVFGIGCKIFTIAGPVILYGITISWGLGLLYWIWTIIK